MTKILAGVLSVFYLLMSGVFAYHDQLVAAILLSFFAGFLAGAVVRSKPHENARNY